MALAILILRTAAYAGILASIQRARNDAGTDVVTPPWWERRPNHGNRDVSTSGHRADHDREPASV